MSQTDKTVVAYHWASPDSVSGRQLVAFAISPDLFEKRWKAEVKPISGMWPFQAFVDKLKAEGIKVETLADVPGVPADGMSKMADTYAKQVKLFDENAGQATFRVTGTGLSTM